MSTGCGKTRRIDAIFDSRRCGMKIHQMLPTLTVGDAIGNQVLAIRGLLRDAGHDSEIFAERWHPDLAGACRHYDEYGKVSGRDNLLLLHYSIGGPSNTYALGLPDRVMLMYHNITPARFFQATNAEFANQLREARAGLKALAQRLPAIAASEYNQAELQGLGFNVIGVAPYIVVRDQLAAGEQSAGAARVRSKYGKRGTQDWLYVGRLAPNKRIEDLIKAFYYHRTWIESQSRLLLVGTGDGNETYVDALYRMVSAFGLDGQVAFCGHWTAEDGLAAFYRMADVYVCMSEHEGFCIPLIEAMGFDVPVLAYAAAGVPYTLGDAGILFGRKDHAAVAEMAHELTTDPRLRATIIAGQRARLSAYDPAMARRQALACILTAAEG
jgi:glycosyltransferase involved in cell wall biosynthesis